MKKKIFRSVLFSMLGIVIAAMALIIIVLNNHFISVEEDRMSVEASLAARGIEMNGEKFLKSIDTENYRITWIDASGTVTYDSQADASQMESHKDREEFKEAISEGSGEAIRYSDTLGRETVYYALKLDDGTVIRISEDYDTVGLLTIRLASPMLWIFLAVFGLSIVLAGSLSTIIAKPINSIDLDHPLENKTYPEVTPLLMRIDQQNQQIEKQMDELHQRKKEFEAVTENMSEGLLLLNKDGGILTMNQSAKILFHMQENSHAKLTDMNEYREFVSSVLKGSSANLDLNVDGRNIKVIGNPIYSHKVLIGASILAYDNTRAHKEETMRREFTANVSHELKTPLQTIMGSAELLQNHLVKDNDRDTFYQKIHSESERMLTLIDDIIRLSQLDENTEADEKNLNISDTANEVRESLQQSADKKHISLQTELHDVHISANSRLLYEIIYNLTDNAIHYTNENGTVRIRCYEENSQACVAVSDNGIGIPYESQDRIFERFYRVDKSHSKATGGTGLGLSIVKHAAEKCHGRITLISSPGKGSSFTVRFPLI